MANITMSDYVGFIFSEITRARVIADGESRRIAELYAKDEVLKSFSVPRFKIPEMNLAIPVIVSGAKFSTVLDFVMDKDTFITLIATKMKNAITTLNIKRNNIFVGPVRINPGTILVNPNIRIPITRAAKRGLNKGKDVDPDEQIIVNFYTLLKDNPDKAAPENIVQVKWAEYFYQKLEANKLTDDYKKYYPNNELLLQTLNEIINTVKQNTYATSTKIENLLVDPETNVVKNNSTDSTVFLINAKIMEEGIFVKSVKNTENGTETKIVEFE